MNFGITDISERKCPAEVVARLHRRAFAGACQSSHRRRSWSARNAAAPLTRPLVAPGPALAVAPAACSFADITVENNDSDFTGHAEAGAHPARRRARLVSSHQHIHII